MSGRYIVNGLVRDPSGKARIDSIGHVHDDIWEMLSKDEQEEIKQHRDHGHKSFNCCKEK